MGYAILRTQKLKSAIAVRRSMKHAFRAQETPNASPALAHDNTHLGAQWLGEGMAAFEAALPEKYRKDAVLAIEYLITASPADMQGKSREEQDRYFADSLAWLRERHGVAQVIYAGIHRDEKTPHMYAYIVPIDPETGRLNAKKWLGGHKALSTMQTDFSEKVGEKHGLQRGIEGSRATHTKLKEFYAAIAQPALEHGEFTAENVQPKVLQKKMFSTISEGPEQVAARLTKMVQSHYEPAVKNAAVARLERRKAEQMAKTADSQAMKLKVARERLKGFEGVFDGLTADQQQSLARAAAEMRQKNTLEAEIKRRLDALPDLVRRAAGAAATFARHALEALKTHAGRWRQVDWAQVDKSTVSEAVGQKNLPMRVVIEAILKHSPAHADTSPEQVGVVLERVEATSPTPSNYHEKPDPKHVRDRGPSR